MEPAQVIEKLKGVLADAISGEGSHAGQPWVECPRDRVHDVLAFLRSDPELAFDSLMDVTAVDYLNQGAPERYAVVYNLLASTTGTRFRVKTWAPEDDPVVPTASDLWKAADWGEREVYDMYGVEFSGHPNLIRIMLPEYYTGHPLRKDYPLRGMGERDHFPKYDREAGV